MSCLVRDLQFVDARGRKYFAADERRRFLEAGARVSEAWAICSKDVDLKAASIRIRTLKRRSEHGREVPVPPDLLRVLELAHALHSAPATAAGRLLWPRPRATAHRRITTIKAAFLGFARQFTLESQNAAATGAPQPKPGSETVEPLALTRWQAPPDSIRDDLEQRHRVYRIQEDDFCRSDTQLIEYCHRNHGPPRSR